MQPHALEECALPTVALQLTAVSWAKSSACHRKRSGQQRMRVEPRHRETRPSLNGRNRTSINACSGESFPALPCNQTLAVLPAAPNLAQLRPPMLSDQDQEEHAGRP